MPLGTCGTCQFFAPEATAHDRGKCHRYPALLNPVWAPMGYFVGVYRADWCGDYAAIAAGASTATVPLAALPGVADGLTASIPQQTPTLTGTAFAFTSGKLVCQTTGTYTFTVTFALARNVLGRVGNGHLLASSVNQYQAPLASVAGSDRVTFTVSLFQPAGAIIDVTFENLSGASQDVTAGGSIAVTGP
jgi:hypothetical protein